MKIYTVLKLGTFKNGKKSVEYFPKQVNWLKAQFDQNGPPNIPFVCLTDANSSEFDSSIEVIPLVHNYPGWWSKLELFKYSDVFYIDLDMVLIRSIADMFDNFETNKFYALNNMSRHVNPQTYKPIMGSGIMAWKNLDLSFIHDEFTISLIPEYSVSSLKWGDQGYIYDKLKWKFEPLQERFPNRIFSYKFDQINKEVPPKSASIIVFHGKPKPWETHHEWIPKLIL